MKIIKENTGMLQNVDPNFEYVPQAQHVETNKALEREKVFGAMKDGIGNSVMKDQTKNKAFTGAPKQEEPKEPVESDNKESELTEKYILDEDLFIMDDNCIGDVCLEPIEDASPIELSAEAVMTAYQNANKWLDSIKESIYTDMNSPFFSSFVHKLAHTMPERFDKFGDILHTCNIKVPYPATVAIEREPADVGESIDMIFVILEEIKKSLNNFIQVTDVSNHGMACAAETLLNDIESEYPMLYRLQGKWNQCHDTVEFDKYVMQYVDHKDDLVESLNKSLTESDDEELPQYEYEISKQVMDSDGFYTDYTMYYDHNNNRYVFVFGDNELYLPEYEDFDYECDTEKEAYEWFDNYKGFEDDYDESGDIDDETYNAIMGEALSDSKEIKTEADKSTAFNDRYFPRVDINNTSRYDTAEFKDKFFAYDKKNNILIYLFKDDEEISKMGWDNAPWRELDSAGLSSDNWNDEEARNDYLYQYNSDLDSESSYLVQDFINNELPYYQNKNESFSKSLKESLNLNEAKNIINVLNKNLRVRFKHSAGGIFFLDRTPFNEDTFNKLIKNNYKMIVDILEEQGLKYDISEDAYISKDTNLYVTIYGDTNGIIVQFEEMESESLKGPLAEDKGQPHSNRYRTYFNRIKRAIEKGDEETLKRTKEAIMYAPAKELKNSEAGELMDMIKNRKINEANKTGTNRYTSNKYSEEDKRELELQKKYQDSQSDREKRADRIANLLTTNSKHALGGITGNPYDDSAINFDDNENVIVYGDDFTRVKSLCDKKGYKMGEPQKISRNDFGSAYGNYKVTIYH